MRPRRAPWVRPATWLGLALLLAGCGDAGQAGGNGAPALSVITRGFASGTLRARYYLSGDGLVAWGIGGVESSGGLNFPHQFSQVPEGDKQLQVVGYQEVTPVEPNPAGVPKTLVRETSRGLLNFSLDGGHNQNIAVAASASGTAQVAIERELLNANYAFDAAGQYAGSPDGSNLALLVFDNADAGQDISVALQFSDDVDAAGLFGTLPDGSKSGAWPSPEAWPTSLTVPTDTSGDAVCNLVARPGQNGHFVDILASGAGLSASGKGQLIVRIAGLASLLAGGE